MKIVIQNLQKKVPVAPKKIKQLVLKALQIEKIKKTGQLNLFFVSDTKIKKLNLKFRGQDYATDVLSFDISRSSSVALADIFISADAAKRNAKIFNTAIQEEISLYVIHGVLHLFGYDDTTRKERRVIEKRQKAILNALKLEGA